MTIRYVRYKSLTWTQKLSQRDQLNLAQETKTNASAHLVQYRFEIREGSPEGIRRL